MPLESLFLFFLLPHYNAFFFFSPSIKAPRAPGALMQRDANTTLRHLTLGVVLPKLVFLEVVQEE